MDTSSKQLAVPPQVQMDPKAIELLRIWAAGGAQHISINATVWQDPANWGIMLVDLARHISNAYEKAGEHTKSDALNRLREGFDAEWTSPTE